MENLPLNIDDLASPEVEGSLEAGEMDNRQLEKDLAKLRETLAADDDGVIHLDIPAYRYSTSVNPFVGTGPTVVRTRQVSRHLDVVFLHRFMYHDILVVGVRSADFVKSSKRKDFVRHIRESGGLPIIGEDSGYDFLAHKFSPFVASDTTAPVFRLYHTEKPHALELPHHPLDVWLIFDVEAYEETGGSGDFRQAYRLKNGYDRNSSLLGVAMIN